jgi:hypothetical protein
MPETQHARSVLDKDVLSPLSQLFLSINMVVLCFGHPELISNLVVFSPFALCIRSRPCFSVVHNSWCVLHSSSLQLMSENGEVV